ncbi:MAG: glycoside hydrolase TIM-barrel-like domain-containing protein [Caulobacterales bacterium]|nr:glycoside hydrolase TIM-barrel-like domain-containing protein [Caulobacterales bacterium]
MAQVILSGIGSQVGGPLGQTIGSALGAQIDRAAVQSLMPSRQIGPRLEQIRIQGASEGAPIPAAFGRVRVTGQIIWAARLRERRHEGRAGKGGPRTADYAYSLSFAVGLCEGPIDGIGRIWADGRPFDVTGVTLRVHRGGEDQVPDALIEAIEGQAPAYRDLAYVVFEDLPLDAFGDRVPQLAFEILRRPRSDQARLEDRLEGICLIPGSGEFVYASEPILRREGLFRTAAENVNNREGRADLLVSLDQLQTQLPNLKRVTLVVSWFGQDLRCGHCEVRPRVDRQAKDTAGQFWRVCGITRAAAQVVSEADGAPAYGGTPSDASVVEAVQELKRRGLEVTLAPFLMMDIPRGNGQDDPYGGTEQAAYAWRGRITCDPAPGQAGTVEQTASADSQVAEFFGTAVAGDFAWDGQTMVYSGPDEWSWRRMVLHYAWLAVAAGADGLLVGSEFRGLTQVRGHSDYPAVEALRVLAGDCRAVLGPTAMITYAADWSEWNAVQHADDPGGVVFNLDPLWADPAISCVGIDWYPPVSDWRDGDDHLDAAARWRGPSDAGYLAAGVQGGEAYDWFYAGVVAREAQNRTPITDAAFDEPWVWRAKDIRGWWSHAHHNRIGGHRSGVATAWTAGMKPVRLIEFGCGAIDKGANSPNLFVDLKSAESALPPFSSGRRDDTVQRRLIEAVLARFDEAAFNPEATTYDGRMIEAMDAWCWDARPFPDFPARTEVWADGDNWRTGHWLNGRLHGEAADLIAAILARFGVMQEDLVLDQIDGSVEGYLIERPMTAAAALSPLLLALGLDLAERSGRLAFVRRGDPIALTEDDLALPDGVGLAETAREVETPPGVARARFMDAAADYAIGGVVARSAGPAGESVLTLDLPMATTDRVALTAAQRALARAAADRIEHRIHVSPLAGVRLEAADEVTLAGQPETWRVARIDYGESCRVLLVPRIDDPIVEGVETWRPGQPSLVRSPPWIEWMDLPGCGDDDGPMVVAAGEPWGAVDLFAGPDIDSLTARARIATPATMGELVDPFLPGPTDRWDQGNRLVVRLEGRSPQSAGDLAVLGGANRIAVRAADGEWEIVQYRFAELVGVDVWKLSGLLRGLGGSEAQAVAGAVAGARVVWLDDSLTQVALNEAERGLPLRVRAAPAGGPAVMPQAGDLEVIWRGVSRRPWSPAHLRQEMHVDGTQVFNWIRRARIGGDSWAIDPPLGEDDERYQVRILGDGAEIAVYETQETSFRWLAAERAARLSGPAPERVTVEVRQASAIWGWGTAARLDI